MSKKNTSPAGADKSATGSAGKKRRYKIGIISTLTTVAVILAVVAVNYFIDYLTYRFVLEIDMTSNSLYEITQDTVDVLITLPEPITITILADETTYESSDTLNPIREILKRYEVLSQGNVKVEFINPNINPQSVAKFDVLGDVSSNDIIVESSKRFKHLTPTNLYELYTDSDSGTQYITGLRAEQRLTSAALYVTAEKVPQAAYILGHGETVNLTQMDKLLASGNYEVTTLNLGMEGSAITRDIDLIIISQPMADYSAQEIDKIDDFLVGGGNAIVLYAPQTPYLERLERYFEEWGVQVKTDYVMDTVQCLAGYPTYIIPNLTSLTGLTDNLSSSMYVAIPGARVMRTLFEENEWRSTTVLMTSSANSYSKSLSETLTSYDQDASDPAGPFPVLVLASNTTVYQLERSYNHILFANAGMMGDSVLSMENLLNSKYFVAALNFMSTDTDTVIIQPKEMSATTLTITGGQTSFLFWLLIIIIPLGILACGLVVWFRRRHM